MHRLAETPLSQVQNQVSVEDLEQDITELEIKAMEQDQEITDHDIAILELQQKLNS